VRFLLALVALSALDGCGPIQSTGALIDAEVEIEAARSAGAPTAAPYEFTAAEAYLHKAREVAGYSRYEDATTYASKARDIAIDAKKKAIAASNRPGPETP